MSDEVSVEATGETVGEAKWKALRDLERAAPGLDKAGVRFQVVSEGERGLLGVGYTPARVIASVSTADAAAPTAASAWALASVSRRCRRRAAAVSASSASGRCSQPAACRASRRGAG